MFCGMAICTAKSGRLEALVEAAQEHAEALARQPGYVASYVLAERDGPSQVSLAIFEDAQAYRNASEATLPVIARHHIERLVEEPPLFRLFEVRSRQ